jgi:catechol 2,3-dioxygenase-like lactoylglutathione lyase family enzyme
MTAPAARLSDEALLSAWEDAAAETPAGRALAVVARTAATAGCAEVDAWTVGRRDGRLLDVHEETFGPEIAAVTACPGCAESLELEFRVSDVRAGWDDDGGEPLELVDDDTGHRVVFRVPTAGDVAAAAVRDDAAGARTALLERCVVAADRNGEPVAPADLPDGVVAAMGALMVERDPQAQVELSLVCAACGHAWAAAFDVADFVWRRLEARARELLAEIATLAAAFAWSEREILALSRERRRLYLDMVGR